MPTADMTKTNLSSLRGDWIDFRYSEESSQPGLTNHLGSLQIEADPIAVKHVIFPPVSSAEETTGMTTLDGQLFCTNGNTVRTRWSLHACEREATLNDWRFYTTTVMVPHEQAVVVEVELTNEWDTIRTADLRLRLSGRCRNTEGEGYAWAVPRVSTPVDMLNLPHGLDVVEGFDPDLNAATFHNISEPCSSVQGVIGSAVSVAWDNGRVTMQPKVMGGESIRFFLLFTYAQQQNDAIDVYTRLAPRCKKIINDVEVYWQGQWDALCAKLEVDGLDELPTDLRVMYEAAATTVLYLRRDYPNICGAGKLLLTLTPRRGEGSFFLWDIGMAAPFAARSNPGAVRSMFEATAAGLDIYARQTLNAFTGRGSGWFYAANIWSLFRMAWGVLCATRDFEWLNKPLTGIREGQSVLDMLTELALVWTTCTPGQEALTSRIRATDPGDPPSHIELPSVPQKSNYPFRLAETGDRASHLEANTTYGHQVASVNAGYVWMMRRLAELHDYRAEANEAERLRKLADNHAKEILKLYRPEDGFFSCGRPDGTIHPSRVSLDHWMVMTCMPEDLNEPVRQGLVQSFKRELQTQAWMRCVSPADSDVVSGYRSDTTWCGSYTGFVALLAEGLCHIGYKDLAAGWLKSMSVIAAQGPYAQAYWAETQRAPIHGGPIKASDEMPQGCHWCEMGGAAFGATILHGILDVPWSPFGE